MCFGRSSRQLSFSTSLPTQPHKTPDTRIKCNDIAATLTHFLVHTSSCTTTSKFSASAVGRYERPPSGLSASLARRRRRRPRVGPSSRRRGGRAVVSLVGCRPQPPKDGRNGLEGQANGTGTDLGPRPAEAVNQHIATSNMPGGCHAIASSWRPQSQHHMSINYQFTGMGSDWFWSRFHRRCEEHKA